MAEQNIVYFDVETQKSIDAAGRDFSKMGVSVGVTFSTERDAYTIYGEDEMGQMIEELLKADLVVGYNHLHFDYPALQGYTILDLESQTLNLDMLVSIQERIGRKVSLDKVASASLGLGKTASGISALKWWKEYKESGDLEPMLKIAEYCAFDVKVTKAVHEYGKENGFVRYDDGGAGGQVEVDW